MNERILNLHDEDQLDEFITLLFKRSDLTDHCITSFVLNVVYVLLILGYNQEFLYDYFSDAMFSYYFNIYLKDE